MHCVHHNDQLHLHRKCTGFFSVPYLLSISVQQGGYTLGLVQSAGLDITYLRDLEPDFGDLNNWSWCNEDRPDHDCSLDHDDDWSRSDGFASEWVEVCDINAEDLLPVSRSVDDWNLHVHKNVTDLCSEEIREEHSTEHRINTVGMEAAMTMAWEQKFLWSPVTDVEAEIHTKVGVATKSLFEVSITFCAHCNHSLNICSVGFRFMAQLFQV